MLDSNLRPGIGFDEFVLGTELKDVLMLLSQKRPPKTIEIRFDEQCLIRNLNIIVLIQDDGIKLHFDPFEQRLILICMFDLTRLQLSLNSGTVLGKGSSPPTFLPLYQYFGPTFPCKFKSSGNCHFYILQYDGMRIDFPVPQVLLDKYGDVEQSGVMPLELPNGSSPVASRIIIHHLKNIPEVSSKKIKTVTISLEKGELEFSSGSLYIKKSSVQDVLSVLGPPSSTHRPLSQSHKRLYFFNYPNLGIDLGLGEYDHKIRKIILHSNFPGHPHFCQYSRCFYELILPENDAFAQKEVVNTIEALERTNVNACNGATASKLVHKKSDSVFKWDEKWEKIQQILNTRIAEGERSSYSQPAVNRGGSLLHPFQTTFLHGVPLFGAIFEVFKSGYINTVTLYGARENFL